jgi:hypothetical protein
VGKGGDGFAFLRKQISGVDDYFDDDFAADEK